MKKIYKQLKNCKTIREIVDIIPNRTFIKISHYSLLLWCLIPILIMLTNVFFKGSSYWYFGFGLLISGFIGLINGIFYFYKNKIKIYKKIPFILLLMFLIWSFISCILSEDKLTAFLGTNFRREGFIAHILYAGIFMNGLIVSKDEKSIKNILISLVITSSILCLSVIIPNEIFNIFIKNSNTYSDTLITSIFSNQNHLSNYLTVAIIGSLLLVIYEKGTFKKFLYVVLYSLLAYTIGYISTLGCWIAIVLTLIFMVIYFLIIKENRIKIITLFLIFMSLTLISTDIRKDIDTLKNDIIKIKDHTDNLLVPSDETINPEDAISSDLVICAGNSRLDLWIKGIKLIKNKPVFGYGFENLYRPYSQIVMCDATDKPHNSFIQIGATTGIVGLLLYVGSLIIILINIIKSSKITNKYVKGTLFICFSYIIALSFGNSMFYTTPYYLLFLGIVSSVCIKECKELEF